MSKHTPNHPPRFIELRNIQAYELMILLSILNKTFNITLNVPSKKAVVFQQFLSVETLWNKKEYLNVNYIVKERCEKRMKKEVQEGVSQKTALRRKHANMIVEMLQLLIDFVRELGYFVETKTFGGKKGTLKEEKIIGIYIENKLICNEKEIKKKGKIIMKKYSITSNEMSSIVIHLNDNFLQSV
ncbi:hypothetical protein EIN_278410 [Entamoeba invadens IP1]|uniref:Uncharacterized protein n=1 Tax=Entamoeba invadens IP1 TaxID=370355 RepID=A0A0A1TVF9_ENTIV|nr:hypothetical protein EIN_278410 [Entamoeba invadens IP1]ELP84351.1 hypothetical protein EIN_278410 [Entamoeba invadens IP1]|eukprot:XP_004183697.1 hypothetical protein EIN_278410 [Entamoeba invadens IP1]